QVAGMAPMLDQAQYIAPGMMMNVGDIQQQQNAKEIADKEWQAQDLQQQPAAALDDEKRRMIPMAQLGKNGPTTTDTSSTPSMAQMIGGGLMTGLGGLFGGGGMFGAAGAFGSKGAFGSPMGWNWG